MSVLHWLAVAGVVAILAAGAFLTLVQTAFQATSRGRALALDRSGDRRAAILARLQETRDDVVAALRLGRILVHVSTAVALTALLQGLAGGLGVAVAAILALVLVVLFGEVMAKVFANARPDTTALRFADVLAVADRTLGPVTRGIDRLGERLLRVFGIDTTREQLSVQAHEEIRGAVDLLAQQGTVAKPERDMLGGLLDLKELVVSDIMVHRLKMQVIENDLSASEVVRRVIESPYTRLPVVGDTAEDVVGVLHARPLLKALHAAGGDATGLDLRLLVTPPWFVPDTTTLHDQLRAFLKRKAHMAFVVDEYGEVMGLVTLEDIIEEIVGDIADETDDEIQGVRVRKDGSVVVDGQVSIRDLNRVLDWELPDDEATTIAGLVIHEARSIPEQGRSFTFHGFDFEVLKRERNRLTKLKITPKDAGARSPVRAS